KRSAHCENLEHLRSPRNDGNTCVGARVCCISSKPELRSSSRVFRWCAYSHGQRRSVARGGKLGNIEFLPRPGHRAPPRPRLLRRRTSARANSGRRPKLQALAESLWVRPEHPREIDSPQWSKLLGRGSHAARLQLSEQ